MNCQICGESLDRIEEDYVTNGSHLACVLQSEEK
jgi:hypothetical protein